MKTNTEHSWAGIGIGIGTACIVAAIGLAIFLAITSIGIAVHLEKNSGPIVVIEHREASK